MHRQRNTPRCWYRIGLRRRRRPVSMTAKMTYKQTVESKPRSFRHLSFLSPLVSACGGFPFCAHSRSYSTGSRRGSSCSLVGQDANHWRDFRYPWPAAAAGARGACRRPLHCRLVESEKPTASPQRSPEKHRLTTDQLAFVAGRHIAFSVASWSLRTRRHGVISDFE